MKFRSSNVVTENRPVSVGIARHQLNSTGTATSHPVGYQNADKPLVEVPADILTLVYLTRCHVAELRLHVLDQFVHVERRTTISVIIRDIIVTMVRYIWYAANSRGPGFGAESEEDRGATTAEKLRGPRVWVPTPGRPAKGRAGCWVWEGPGVATSRSEGPGVSARKIFEDSDAKSCILETTSCEISCFLKTTAKKLGGPIHCWWVPVSPGPYGCCAYLVGVGVSLNETPTPGSICFIGTLV